jgi:hypothetical protein
MAQKSHELDETETVRRGLIFTSVVCKESRRPASVNHIISQPTRTNRAYAFQTFYFDCTNTRPVEFVSPNQVSKKKSRSRGQPVASQRQYQRPFHPDASGHGRPSDTPISFTTGHDRTRRSRVPRSTVRKHASLTSCLSPFKSHFSYVQFADSGLVIP